MHSYDLEKILLEKELYERTKQNIEEIIMSDLDKRNDDVTIHLVEGNFFDMSLGNLWTILILARPFMEYNKPFTEDFIVDVSDIKVLNGYFDLVITYFTENEIDVSECLLDVLSELAVVSSKILGVYGATINLFDVCRLMEENQEFRKIIDFNFRDLDKHLEFEEMNKILDDVLDKLMEILTTEENCFKNLILSGSGISDRQLRETLVSIGPKPDEKGNIIPEPVDTSYIKGQTPFDFLIDSFGARKAYYGSFIQ